MEKTHLYRFYMFGWDFHMLYGGYTSKSVKDAREFIKKITDFAENQHLDVTTQVIKSESSDLLKNLNSQKADETASKVSMEETKLFARTIEKTLDAELRLKYAFILTPKRLDLNKLLDNVEELFGTGIFEKMSNLSKKDFREAGKCIAFERPTAAAFHILRATEETLRSFYHRKIPKKEQNELPLWKSMIDQLRKKPKVSKSILDSFDNIRSNFRNFTIHTDTFYTMDEIQDLLLLCIEANSRATKELSK